MMNLHLDRAHGFAVIVLALASAVPVMAQAPASPAGGASATAPAQPYWAAVNANNVFIRCAPSMNASYPFGKLASGDVVQVLEESYGWARVRCAGPAFKSIYGYVPADRRVELSSDGNTIKVTAKTEIKAPNAGSKESPDASWKPIAKLSPGESLVVLGTVEGEREKVYKVALTESAEGFVNLNYLRRASSAEVDAYRNPVTVAAAPPKPPATPSTGTGPAGAKSAPSGGQSPRGDANARTANADARGAGGASPSGAGPNTAGGDSANPDGVPPPIAKPISAETSTSEPVDASAAEMGGPDIGGDATPASANERGTVVTRPKKDAERTSAASPQQLESTANRREYEDLEATWNTVKHEALENAEVNALRSRYLELVTRPNVPAEIREMAKARTEQLGLKVEVQERLYALGRLRSQRDQDLDRIVAIKIAMEARSDYDAVGVLNASSVFDGNRLPALYRLQDPAVGQTVAYVAPREDFELATMLGVLVGIKGEKKYDQALRVNVFVPRSVQILTQRRDPQVSTPASSSVDAGSPAGSPAPAAGVPASPASNQPPPEFAPVPPDAP